MADRMRLFGISLLLFVFLIPGTFVGQDMFKRLILKDGSFELITTYEIKGDRVHYFSAERNDWEELPSSLIDWPATEEYARQAADEASRKKEEALESAALERSEEEARMPYVAPGLRVPSPDGVYLLDTYQDQPGLLPLAQNGADLKKNTGSNILRSIINPIAGPKQTVELKGPQARIQSHVTSPSILFPIRPDDPSIGYDSKAAQNHLRLVRCKEKNGNRIVAVLDIAIYGKVKNRAEFLEAEVAPVSDYWVKITPSTSLKPGEYALVEFDGKGAMNQYVWDFGVNPSAPANPAAVLSVPDRSEPVLIEKPHRKPDQK